ncbi:MAG: hypothetical protein BWY11_00776 [Firmicutes bacterium ADurb.Bin182]|nr:MAG: hypothetical protein BWY11_00776 [Firmicutes bacterium ADurb.Bin182]
MLERLLGLSLDEIKNGYAENTEKRTHACLICGKEFEAGEVFPFDGRFYDAQKAVRLHVEKEHGNMLDILTSFDKKLTGLTENQKQLISMICDGLSDGEIAKRTGVAAATVRHQRFVFREKAKQAKTYLAIFEIMEKAVSDKRGKGYEDELLDIHEGAKMIDDRYLITESEEKKISASVFESLEPLKLKYFSSKEKKKVVILRRIAQRFEKGVKYSEKDVNAVLKDIYDDYVTIRRYLIEYGFMERTRDCKEYWLT